MNTESMMNIAKQTLASMDLTQVKRIDLQNYEYPDGTPVYTINILMRQPEAAPVNDESITMGDVPVTEPTEAADESVVPEAVTEADGQQ